MDNLFFLHTSFLFHYFRYVDQLQILLYTTMKHFCTFVVIIFVAMTASPEAPVTEQNNNKVKSSRNHLTFMEKALHMHVCTHTQST